jgi:hypothetical protein
MVRTPLYDPRLDNSRPRIGHTVRVIDGALVPVEDPHYLPSKNRAAFLVGTRLGHLWVEAVRDDRGRLVLWAEKPYAA